MMVFKRSVDQANAQSECGENAEHFHFQPVFVKVALRSRGTAFLIEVQIITEVERAFNAIFPSHFPIWSKFLNVAFGEQNQR